MTEDQNLRWTGASKRAFLETFAGSGSIARACIAAGKSREAASKLALRHEEEAFRLGWGAAQLVAHSAILDTLMERVVDGVEIVTVRDTSDPDKRVTRRTSYGQRIGLDLLGRLERMIERPLDWQSSRSDAALAARDFPGLLDLVEADASFAEARAFVADLGARVRGENRQIHCQLAEEEAGASEPEYDEEERHAEWLDRKARDLCTWRFEGKGEWRTDFPPPPGFDGQQCGDFGSPGYWRTLAPDEEAEMAAFAAEEDEKLRAAAEQARQIWFDCARIETKALSGAMPLCFDRRRERFDERYEQSSPPQGAPLRRPHKAGPRGGAGGPRKGRM